MQHPTDRVAHTILFVTPVLENWLECYGISVCVPNVCLVELCFTCVRYLTYMKLL